MTNTHHRQDQHITACDAFITNPTALNWIYLYNQAILLSHHYRTHTSLTQLQPTAQPQFVTIALTMHIVHDFLSSYQY